jgi:hypothetical protein
MSLLKDFVEQKVFFFDGAGLLLYFFFLLLALFSLLSLLLFLFLAGVTLNFFLESEVDLDPVVLLEVTRHRDFDYTGIVLEIKEELIQVDVETLGSGVEEAEVLLHFANAADGALEDALDKNALLGVHDLVVAVFKLAVNFNVLNVQAGQVLENFIVGPGLDILHKGNG